MGPRQIDLRKFRGAVITGSAAGDTVHNGSGTGFGLGALGQYCKMLFNTTIVDTESCVNIVTTTGAITAITAGNPTQVTLDVNPNSLATGDFLYLSGVTGADAAFVNEQVFKITNVAGLVFSLDVNTTAKTLTAAGFAYDGNGGTISVPSWVQDVKVTGHISFPSQAVAAGLGSGHLWRAVASANLTTTGSLAANYGGGTGATYVDVGHRPTPEAHYHNRVYYPLNAGAYISVLAHTPWIPVMATNEVWSLFAWQNTGASVTTTSGVEQWLCVEFR